MACESNTPIGSRWKLKAEHQGRVFYVLEKKGFGRLDLAQEGHPIFCEATKSELLSDWERLPGSTAPPTGYYANT